MSTPITVWSLTVDGPDSGGIVTQVFGTEAEVYESLVTNHADGWEGVTAHNVIDKLTEEGGYCLYVDTHTVFPALKKSPWPQGGAEQAEFRDWQYEVANGDTAAAFRDWLTRRQECLPCCGDHDDICDAGECDTCPVDRTFTL